jgi:hypothetical protein
MSADSKVAASGKNFQKFQKSLFWRLTTSSSSMRIAQADLFGGTE